MGERGQIYTLEGLFAALVILAGVFFALQATTTTPGDVGTNPHSIQQDRALVTDLVNVADERTMEKALLYWSHTENDFHCTPDGSAFYPGINDVDECDDTPDTDEFADYVPTNQLGELFDGHFGDAYSYNVIVRYNTSSGVEDQRMVYQGNPGVGAVSASTTVTLEDNDQLLDDDFDKNGTTVLDAANNDNFYAPKIEEIGGGATLDDRVFNVFRVEVTVWRA